jgi:hypothetical protein
MVLNNMYILNNPLSMLFCIAHCKILKFRNEYLKNKKIRN